MDEKGSTVDSLSFLRYLLNLVPCLLHARNIKQSSKILFSSSKKKYGTVLHLLPIKKASLLAKSFFHKTEKLKKISTFFSISTTKNCYVHTFICCCCCWI